LFLPTLKITKKSFKTVTTYNSSYLVEFRNPENDSTVLTAFEYLGDYTTVNPNIWIYAEFQRIWDAINYIPVE